MASPGKLRFSVGPVSVDLDDLGLRISRQPVYDDVQAVSDDLNPAMARRDGPAAIEALMRLADIARPSEKLRAAALHAEMTDPSTPWNERDHEAQSALLRQIEQCASDLQNVILERLQAQHWGPDEPAPPQPAPDPAGPDRARTARLALVKLQRAGIAIRDKQILSSLNLSVYRLFTAECGRVVTRRVPVEG